jgi:hypothetical protein
VSPAGLFKIIFIKRIPETTVDPKNPFLLRETQKTLEKRLCGEPLEQQTHPPMVGFAELVATFTCVEVA